MPEHIDLLYSNAMIKLDKSLAKHGEQSLDILYNVVLEEIGEVIKEMNELEWQTPKANFKKFTEEIEDVIAVCLVFNRYMRVDEIDMDENMTNNELLQDMFGSLSYKPHFEEYIADMVHQICFYLYIRFYNKYAK